MGKIMDIREFRSRVANRDISRRDAHKVLASLGLATVAVPMVRARAQDGGADPDLTVFTWAGYDAPEFVGGYIEKHGMAPSFTFWGEEEEGFQKMRAGFRPDVAAPCTYSLRRWYDAGLLKPLDTSRLEHWDDIFPSLKTVEGSVLDGHRVFLPIDWGNSSVLFRPDLAPEYSGPENHSWTILPAGPIDAADDKYSGPPIWARSRLGDGPIEADDKYSGPENHSWTILFDEKYAGRLGIHDSVDGVFGVVGAVIGAENPFDMTDEELERATEMMRKQRDVLRWYWTDVTSIEQGLASGELVAAYAWNESVVELKSQGVPVEYMNPKEGIYTWVRGSVHIATGEAPDDKVYDYLNAVSSPEAGFFEITEFGYGHANMKAFDLVDRQVLDDLGISDPVAFMAATRYFSEIPPATREKYIALFDEIKAGF